MSWTHLKDETPVARKQHQCFCCCTMIEPGERHVMRAGIREGQFHSFRMHADCEAETRSWDEFDWDRFSTGTMRRPSAREKGAAP